MSREAFGELFDSHESTVYQWECGRCVPLLPKLLAIANYFGVSLDIILSGKLHGNSTLEKRLSTAEKAGKFGVADYDYTGRVIAQFNSLSDNSKERLLGYLDALSKLGD